MGGQTNHIHTHTHTHNYTTNTSTQTQPTNSIFQCTENKCDNWVTFGSSPKPQCNDWTDCKKTFCETKDRIKSSVPNVCESNQSVCNFFLNTKVDCNNM